MARRRLRAAEWASLIDEWRQSGLGLPAFCKQRGLSRGTMQNWAYKPALKLAVENASRASQARRDAPVATAELPTPRPLFFRSGLRGSPLPRPQSSRGNHDLRVF